MDREFREALVEKLLKIALTRSCDSSILPFSLLVLSAQMGVCGRNVREGYLVR